MKFYLGKGSKAISSAASVGNNIKFWLVVLLINTNNKHGCILAWCRNYNLPGTTLITSQIQINLPFYITDNFHNGR